MYSCRTGTYSACQIGPSVSHWFQLCMTSGAQSIPLLCAAPAANVCSNLTVHATLIAPLASITTVTPSGGPEACCASCAATVGCNFWSLYRSGGYGDGSCSLYASAFGIQNVPYYYYNDAGSVNSSAPCRPAWWLWNKETAGLRQIACSVACSQSCLIRLRHCTGIFLAQRCWLAQDWLVNSQDALSLFDVHARHCDIATVLHYR
jgi:hypothetical protein